MKNKSNLLACAVALLVTGGAVIPSEAAFDENLNTYTLDAVVVNAERTKNQFGDTITEQSYYRTGGDVKVISREEIEKRHYNDVTEAIKRIPGVTFTNAGYRGGQYGPIVIRWLLMGIPELLSSLMADVLITLQVQIWGPATPAAVQLWLI